MSLASAEPGLQVRIYPDTLPYMLENQVFKFRIAIIGATEPVSIKLSLLNTTTLEFGGVRWDDVPPTEMDAYASKPPKSSELDVKMMTEHLEIHAPTGNGHIRLQISSPDGQFSTIVIEGEERRPRRQRSILRHPPHAVVEADGIIGIMLTETPNVQLGPPAPSTPEGDGTPDAHSSISDETEESLPLRVFAAQHLRIPGPQLPPLEAPERPDLIGDTCVVASMTPNDDPADLRTVANTVRNPHDPTGHPIGIVSDTSLLIASPVVAEFEADLPTDGHRPIEGHEAPDGAPAFFLIPTDEDLPSDTTSDEPFPMDAGEPPPEMVPAAPAPEPTGANVSDGTTRDGSVREQVEEFLGEEHDGWKDPPPRKSGLTLILGLLTVIVLLVGVIAHLLMQEDGNDPPPAELLAAAPMSRSELPLPSGDDGSAVEMGQPGEQGLPIEAIPIEELGIQLQGEVVPASPDDTEAADTGSPEDAELAPEPEPWVERPCQQPTPLNGSAEPDGCRIFGCFDGTTAHAVAWRSEPSGWQHCERNPTESDDLTCVQVGTTTYKFSSAKKQWVQTRCSVTD